jgi:hypothetical protein
MNELLKASLIQWAPLNGIMDNGINWLMESNLSSLQVPNFSVIPKVGWS